SSPALPVTRADALAARLHRRGNGLRLGRRARAHVQRRLAAGPLHELAERQVEQVAAGFLVDDHLAGGAEDLLHGLEVEAIARDLRRALVFREDLAEARAVALGG